MIARKAMFQFTRSSRSATGQMREAYEGLQFQFTRSSRSATKPVANARRERRVSIHALLAERDRSR